MSRRFLPIVTLSLWTAGTLLLAGVARSEVKLTSATVRNLKNRVELQPKGERWRGASVGNLLQPLDALRTAAQSWAELRFNDRSLARIGERAQFQFLPDTRTFNLRNGTVLLLIPPKQGRTRVETPNAVAGIRGSALFVRYNPETETTIVGALTNSEIEVGQNKEGSPPVVLKAGQMAVLVQDKIFQIYQFDLKTFYETSEMVRDLDLQKQPSSSDEAIAAVQAETSEALNSQPSAATAAVVNPPWVTMTAPTTNNNLVDANTPLQTGIDRSLKEGIFPLTTPPEIAADKYRNSTTDIVPPSPPGAIPSTPAATGPVGTNPGNPTSPGGLGSQGVSDGNRPQTPSNPPPAATPQPINNRPSTPSSPNLQPPSAPAQSPPAVVTTPPVQTPAPVVSTPPVQSPPVVVNPPVQTPAPVVSTPPVTPPPNQVQPVVTNPTPVVTSPPPVVQPPTPVTPPVVAAPTPPVQPSPVVTTPTQPPVYNRPTTPAVPAVPAVPTTPVTPVTPAIPAQPPVVSAPAPAPVVTPVVQPAPQPVTVAPTPAATLPVTPTVTPSTTVSPLLNNQATVTTPTPAPAPTPTPVQAATQTTTPTTGTTTP